MPTYRVQVHGENFITEFDGRVAARGFLTLRIVEAADPEAAEVEAIEKVRLTQQLRDVVCNTPEDPPIMQVTEMEELGPGDVGEGVPTGLIWYENPPKKWWKFWK